MWGELTREKLVDNKDGKYAVSVNAKSDMRYFADEFGSHMLYCSMGNFFPDENNIEQNISTLIKIFGTYLIFCFIEASRPISDNIASEKGTFNMHALISRYLHNVFPVETMYKYFVSIVKYIFDKNGNKKQECISLSRALDKFNLKEDVDLKVKFKEETSTPCNGGDDSDNNKLFRISAWEILEAFMMKHVKCIEQHTTIKQYYGNEQQQREQREQQYDILLKETNRLYELDQTTVKSLDNELRNIIDGKTYDLLSSEMETDTLDNKLNRLKIKKMDPSKLEKLKSDIERSRPKNKAVLAIIENTQAYFSRNNNK
jgi:hypothetical protein